MAARVGSFLFHAGSTGSCSVVFCREVPRTCSARWTGSWPSSRRAPGSTSPTPTPPTRTEKGIPFVDDTPPRGYDEDHDDLAAALDFSPPARSDASDLDALGGYVVGREGASY